MLTSADETDLLLPLLAGAGGAAPFADFFARLQRRTRARWCGLAPGDNARDDVWDDARDDMPGEGALAPGATLALAAAMRAAHPRPGRVYALAELEHPPEGIGDTRFVLVPGAEAAFLAMVRDEGCTAADAALLSALAPYVGAALGQQLAAARAARRARLAEDALARAGAGWISLSAQGRVLDAAPGFARQLEAAGIRLRPGQRLAPLAAAVGASALDGRPRAAVLSKQPRIDAVLRPDAGGEAVTALCRFAPDPPSEAPALFAQLSGLPPREAEFAARLGLGASIAEAGAAMGLTIETARNYSKKIYARLGLRGQAELVRRFCESGASLA